MKLTPMGKLALFLVALGVAFGGWKAFQKAGGTVPGSGGQTTIAQNSNSGLNGGDTAPTTSANTDGAQTNTQTPSTVGANELQIVTSASKRGWLSVQIDKFNAQSDVKVVPKLVETREAMQGIISGRLKPALWSPSSVIWADRLSEVLERNRAVATRYGRPELVSLCSQNAACVFNEQRQREDFAATAPFARVLDERAKVIEWSNRVSGRLQMGARRPAERQFGNADFGAHRQRLRQPNRTKRLDSKPRQLARVFELSQIARIENRLQRGSAKRVVGAREFVCRRPVALRFYHGLRIVGGGRHRAKPGCRRHLSQPNGERRKRRRVFELA